MDYSYENNFKETKIDFDIEFITKKRKKKEKINYIEITIPLKREQIWCDAIIQMSWIILIILILLRSYVRQFFEKINKKKKEKWKYEKLKTRKLLY